MNDEEVILLVSVLAAVLFAWTAKPRKERTSAALWNSQREFPDKVERWRPYVQEAIDGLHLPEQLIMAIIEQESGGDPNAVGSVGEVGLMQVTDIAARDAGYSEAVQYPALMNIKQGVDYYNKCLLNYAGGDYFKALACYNGGPNGWSIPAARNYANEVLERL